MPSPPRAVIEAEPDAGPAHVAGDDEHHTAPSAVGAIDDGRPSR
jgi:hypothetical protein